MQAQIFVAAGAIGAALSVILGAFGAHALKSQLTAASLGTYETAVQYQMTHSLALVLVGLLMMVLEPKTTFLVAGVSFALGLILFSGSLYGLALWELRWLGPVTPIGGVLFIIGWLAIVTGAVSGGIGQSHP